MILNRRWFTEKTTIGELFLNPSDEGTRGFECYVLEDKYRGDAPKVPGETCIPYGTYEVIVDFSPKFQTDMLHVMNVPGFEGIRIHPGNVAEDTEGCLLPGITREVDHVNFSRPAYAQLGQKIRAALGRGEKVFLTIQPAPLLHATP